MIFTKHQKTQILPLRIIGNFCGNVSIYFLDQALYLDDYGNNGWRYKTNMKIWSILHYPYNKWGTYYKTNEKKIDKPKSKRYN